MKPLRTFGVTVVVALLPYLGAAQNLPDSTETGWTFGIAGGVNIPIGEWSDHPYATGVKQFGLSWTASAEIAYHTSRKFSFALLGYYAPLATGEWTEYAASQGAEIQASASMTMLLLALRPRSFTDGTNAITIELSGGILLSSGQESYGTFTYDYTFLPEVSGVFAGGLEYERWVSSETALFIRGTFAIAFTAVKYGDGRSTTLRTIPIVAGLRFRL